MMMPLNPNKMHTMALRMSRTTVRWRAVMSLKLLRTSPCRSFPPDQSGSGFTIIEGNIIVNRDTRFLFVMFFLYSSIWLIIIVLLFNISAFNSSHPQVPPLEAPRRFRPLNALSRHGYPRLRQPCYCSSWWMGVKLENLYETKKIPKSTLLADKTQGQITTKQIVDREYSEVHSDGSKL